MGEPIDAICMACYGPECDFKPMRFQRRPVGDDDVLIDMKYCGMCHSDVVWAQGYAELMMGRPDWANGASPGHELAGVCTAVGKNVRKVKVGDHVGVGCIVDACLTCGSCKKGDENFCYKQATMTYGGKNTHGRAAQVPEGQLTKGGYCTKIVVHEHFCIIIPKTYPLEKAGPVMCAGITMYEPLKHHKIGKGHTVGIVGLGGLGITGMKIAKALGCKVVGISRSPQKKQIALNAGADSYIAMSVPEDVTANQQSMDIILNTIPVKHDVVVYTQLLNKTGKQIVLGIIPGFGAAALCCLFTGGKSPMSFSGIGGIPNTQEVIDLCDKHKIYPETTVIPASDINKVFELADNGNDAGVRYVLDIAGTLKEETFNSIKCAAPPKFGVHTPELTCGGVLKDFCRMFPRFVVGTWCSGRGTIVLGMTVVAVSIAAMKLQARNTAQ